MSLLLERLTRTVTLRRVTSSGVDEYGSPTESETTEAVVAHVRKLSSDELGSGVSGSRLKVYLAPGTSIDVDDRVTFDGELYEVVSVPTQRYNPRTRLVVSVECEIEARS